jgi:hypothetical protein
MMALAIEKNAAFLHTRCFVFQQLALIDDAAVEDVTVWNSDYKRRKSLWRWWRWQQWRE